MEARGGPEGRAVVDHACANGILALRAAPKGMPARPRVADVASSYRAAMWNAAPNTVMLILALERCGTPEMAADFLNSDSRLLAAYAAQWARRKGHSEAVKPLVANEVLRRAIDDPGLLQPVSPFWPYDDGTGLK